MLKPKNALNPTRLFDKQKAPSARPMPQAKPMPYRSLAKPLREAMPSGRGAKPGYGMQPVRQPLQHVSVTPRVGTPSLAKPVITKSPVSTQPVKRPDLAMQRKKPGQRFVV